MSALYMYTFMPIIFLIVVTAMWLHHKVKKQSLLRIKQHQNTKNRNMRS